MKSFAAIALALVLSRCANVPFIDDEHAPRPITLDVAIDASEGSTGSPETLRETLGRCLPAMSRIPGSRLRVWFLGADVATTELIADLTVPTPKRKGERGLRASGERFSREAEAYVMKAAQPLFDRPPRKRSPILEGLGRVSLASAAPGHTHHVIVISDAREVSAYFDAECDARLPKAEALIAALQRDQVLTSGRFANASITFAFSSIGPVDRTGCPAVTLTRAVESQTLYRAVLVAAGARRVDFEPGPPSLQSHEEEL